MNFIIKLISTFCKAYWTGCVVIIRAWYKLFGSKMVNIASCSLGLLTLIIFIVVAVKWGLLKAIMCSVIFTIAQTIATMITGSIYTAKTGESFSCIEYIMEGLSNACETTMHEDINKEAKPNSAFKA